VSSAGEGETQSGEFEVVLPGSPKWDPRNDNLDVEVRFADGRRYSATFFTLSNVETLLRRYARSGECANGLYLWASDMILVETLTLDVIERVVQDLIASGELPKALSELPRGGER
jgi:hypothetical protein